MAIYFLSPYSDQIAQVLYSLFPIRFSNGNNPIINRVQKMGKDDIQNASSFITSCTQKEVLGMLFYDIAPEDCRDLPEILRPGEVADFLCIHKNTVYKLIRRGELPAFRVGRSWRIRREVLAELVEENP